jgi:hypothetical protein
MPPKVAAKKKTANGYKMPEKLTEGTILPTLMNMKFRTGKSIGKVYFFTMLSSIIIQLINFN